MDDGGSVPAIEELPEANAMPVLPAEQRNDAVDDLTLRGLGQHSDTARDERRVCSKQLTRTGETDVVQRTRLEIQILKPNRIRVCVRVTGHLTENVIAPSDVGEHDRWPQLAGRKVRKGKDHQDY